MAKQAGASIILLIVNVLTDEALRDLYDYATSLGLESLIEVHDRQELARAYKLDPKIIGVNNRDLRRFVTDVLHTNEILQDKNQDITIFQKVVFMTNKMLKILLIQVSMAC